TCRRCSGTRAHDDIRRRTPDDRSCCMTVANALPPVLRWTAWVALAFALYAAVLLAFGHDPLAAYRDIIANTIASPYGIGETLVKFIPLALTALAVTVPGRLGLVNVGGEG